MDDRWTGEAWRRADELFSAALDLAPDERGAFLDEACGDEAQLRETVEELLAAVGDADDLVDRSAALLARAARSALGGGDLGLAPGTRLGPYLIDRWIARGGMGSVYRAARADGQFEQIVALKVLRRGLDTEDFLARFRAERQLLASFSHPNIARLLDGGSTHDGRPYLVMEFVEGDRIDVHCDRLRLSIRDRIRLFRAVCGAVAHAHRSLVVHRDLKPGNVLVTPSGEPKLLDFGIAKLLSPATGPAVVPLTRPGVRLLSPLYASPEQVEGGAVTTASDVYALGVMLYELMTGHHPHEGDPGERRTEREVEKAIVEEEPTDPAAAAATPCPPRPAGDGEPPRTPEKIARARGTTPGALRRRLSGDLALILGKALRKEPEERYSSAERLSEELGRYLDRRPVTARGDTLRYRTSKFVRRHAAGVAAAALVVLALVGGIAAATWQASRASEAAEAARVEARNAEGVTDLLVELFRAPDGEAAAVGDTLTARAVLDRGLARMREELADQPEVRARMLHVGGEVYGNLGHYDRGRPLLREALHLRRGLYGDEHAEVAESLEALAGLLRSERDFRAAVPLYREALSIRRTLEPDTAMAIARTAGGLALALRDAGRADTAVTVMREVLELKRRRLGADHEESLEAQAALAYALRGRGELEEAEAQYRDVLPRMRRAGLPPAALAANLNNLAYVLKARGDARAAADMYRAALAEARRAHGEDHPNSLMVMTNLSSALSAAGDTSGATTVLEERLRLTRAAHPGGHWRVGSAAHALGVALDRQGRHREAERHFRETLEIWRGELGEDHDWTARARGQLGGCLLAQGRHAEAEPLLLESHAVLSESLAPDAPWARQATARLVTLYHRWGREDRAERYRERLAAAGDPEG